MKIVQILNNKAHWIFEAESIPNYPPDPEGKEIILVDITNQPDVQEGWEYDPETQTFTKPTPSQQDLEESPHLTDAQLPITHEDLMEIQLLHLKLTLENLTAKKNGRMLRKEDSSLLNSIIKGFAILIFRNKLTTANIPISIREKVEEELIAMYKKALTEGKIQLNQVPDDFIEAVNILLNADDKRTGTES